MNRAQLNTEIFDAVFEDIIGYTGLYKISKNGEIWSCWCKLVMTPSIDESGYLVIGLKKDGVKHKGRLHRLLAIQYILNPENKPEVDHINRIKNDNRLCNLRWATHSENQLNKSTSICGMTELEQEERKKNIREYKRIWAYNKSREQGCQIKEEMTKTKDSKYLKKRGQEYRANMSEEKKEERRERERQRYKNGGDEYQKEYIKRPEVIERRLEREKNKRANYTEDDKEKQNQRSKEYYESNIEKCREKAREKHRLKRASMTEEEKEAAREKRRVKKESC